MPGGAFSAQLKPTDRRIAPNGKEQGGIPLQAVNVEVACALDTKHTAIRRPSSPTPSLPESVDSWSSDVLAESHDQLVSQGYWNNSSSANSRFQDEDCAIDNLHLGLQVDLLYVRIQGRPSDVQRLPGRRVSVVTRRSQSNTQHSASTATTVLHTRLASISSFCNNSMHHNTRRRHLTRTRDPCSWYIRHESRR